MDDHQEMLWRKSTNKPQEGLNLSYNEHVPATSIDRGVSVSTTWGRFKWTLTCELPPAPQAIFHF
jgi:hypothetical protein